MESNVYKTDFSYFVRMALQDNMAWKSLSMILKDLTPSLDETREVIVILLKELEALQMTLKEKDKELEMYQNVCPSVVTQNLTLKTKAIRENMQSSASESETIEDEIEVLELVGETMNDEILLDMTKGSKLSDTLANENDERDPGDADESVSEIDNDWYTFIKNSKTSEQEPDEPFQEEESYTETEPMSSNESAYKSVIGKDNEWYTFVTNDKKCDSETEKTEVSEVIVVKQTKKRPYQHSVEISRFYCHSYLT